MLTWFTSGGRFDSAVSFPLTHLDGAQLSVVPCGQSLKHPFNGWARKMVSALTAGARRGHLRRSVIDPPVPPLKLHAIRSVSRVEFAQRRFRKTTYRAFLV
ncbi:hypothetical protein EVAR_91916_1 [Eumeta japonica]|uniref:Uncharacterized protein n=1 Tax=Eumeta variegata TaxID=151549 RepID=A0A4C1T3F9_EUMVA|nr:hypothetical protein EVAR_91916_1 [Eumeta japonica]